MDTLSTSLETEPANAGILAPDAASDLQARVKQAATDRIQSAAEFLRNQTDTPVVGRYAEPTARGMEQAARYVQDSTFESVHDDVTAVIRRYPLRSLAIGLGIGILLGRRGNR